MQLVAFMLISALKRFCRFCQALRINLNDISDEAELRTKQAYQVQIKSINADPSLSPVYGILSDSCLNSLEYYHVINGLPPDFAHDVLEGFAKDITKNVIVYMIKEKYITLDDLNDSIENFKYSEVDKKNKPQRIPENSLKNLKVKQTAAEMWSFLRLLPFLIADKIPNSNDQWRNYISFLEIIDRLCASSFSHPDLVILHQLIDDFFEVYVKLYPDDNLKPKAHFIRHYPMMIKKFGPLIKTLRFESKNGQIKSFVANNKNKKNLCYSLAKKHQMLMYLTYKKKLMLDHQAVTVIGSFETSLFSLLNSEKELFINLLGELKDTFISQARAAVFEGQRYSCGEAVVLSFENDEYLFGKIFSVFHTPHICMIISVTIFL